jgi:Zn-finger nucleic acid-binding protein
MNCPKCRTPTLRHEAEAASGLRLDRCSSCGGTWLDYGELGPAAEREDPSRPPGPDPDLAADLRTGSCPRCGVALQQALSPDGAFHVDRCPRCGGLFLDRGELAAIAARHLVDGLERVLAPHPPPAAPPPARRPTGLGPEDRAVLARAADLAARHSEAAAFLRKHLDPEAHR